MELEEKLKALALHQKLASFELEDVVAKEATSLEKLIAQARARADGRKEAGKRRAKKNAQRRRAREWKRQYAKDRAVMFLEDVPEKGWWKHVHEKMRGELKISREQWDEHIALSLGDEEPQLYRYDLKKGFTLDNVWIVSRETHAVLWDGKEAIMRELGYIL